MEIGSKCRAAQRRAGGGLALPMLGLAGVALAQARWRPTLPPVRIAQQRGRKHRSGSRRTMRSDYSSTLTVIVRWMECSRQLQERRASAVAVRIRGWLCLRLADPTPAGVSASGRARTSPGTASSTMTTAWCLARLIDSTIDDYINRTRVSSSTMRIRNIEQAKFAGVDLSARWRARWLHGGAWRLLLHRRAILRDRGCMRELVAFERLRHQLRSGRNAQVNRH